MAKMYGDRHSNVDFVRSLLTKTVGSINLIAEMVIPMEIDDGRAVGNTTTYVKSSVSSGNKTTG